MVLIPRVYHSSENDLGIGVQAVRPFRLPGATEFAADSELRIKGRLHTVGHGAAEARATLLFGDGRWSLVAKLVYDDLAQRYWGVGSDSPSSAEEIYRAQELRAYAEFACEVWPHLRLGLRAERQDYRYLDIEDGGLLDTTDAPSRHRNDVVGAGPIWDYDTRDNRYAPGRGWWIQGYGLFFDDAVGSHFDFTNWYLDVRCYQTLPSRTVVALQFFGFSLLGDPPLWRYASLGGREHSRGYRRDRYLDQRMLAFQAELRRPIAGRAEGVVFAGLANVARRFDRIRLDTMRPTLGGGVRYRLREARDLVIRADLAFGEDSVRSYFGVGHAF